MLGLFHAVQPSNIPARSPKFHLIPFHETIYREYWASHLSRGQGLSSPRKTALGIHN